MGINERMIDLERKVEELSLIKQVSEPLKETKKKKRKGKGWGIFLLFVLVFLSGMSLVVLAFRYNVFFTEESIKYICSSVYNITG